MANTPLGKAAEKQRRRNIMKILNELNTTYGVKVCAIIMDRPYSQGVKVETEEEMLEKKIEEAKEKLKKQREENRVKELTIKLYEIIKAGEVPKDLDVDELKEIDYVISLVLKEIDEKLMLKNLRATEK